MKLQTPKYASLILTAWIVLLVAVSTLPVSATSGPREAQGVVLDGDGNPVAGAQVTFTPADSANDQPVSAKTNKKGRFFVNLFSDRGDGFSIAVEAEGYLPVEVFLESRTVNRVLLGDPIEKKIKYGQNLPDIFIRPLGQGEVKITLAPAADVMAAAQAEAQAAGARADGTETAAVPQKDPWDEALALAADGDLAEAVPFFEKAIEKKPDDVERREAFAKVLYQLDRHDEAVEQAGKAVELAPQSLGPRMVIYSAHVARGDLDAAKTILEEAHEIAPQNLNVVEQMAYVADRQGDPAAAIAVYEEFVAVNDTEADVWARLGDLYAKVGELAKSEAAYEKVGALDPDGAHTVFFNIGALIMNRPSRTAEETEKAIEAFRNAIEAKPDYAEAHKQLAFALLGSGDRAGAKSALQAYVECAPGAPDAEQMKNLAAAM
jgi:tetratricopeptide (TPR) repeat protein